ncbi:hypothetical protein P3875_00835 [Myroides sp. JBRI-B21084]|uniref:hypothetical protein n=1 Tax=Myroides sp. JBRI-B21084 TaxID=3119977 RepID=UPI0026E117F5|nr:hypothetical protein [Paenimyroides cloacae]WKW46657.1 hypothetical protein P3875_00835 [Paenimyroides cloacae]
MKFFKILILILFIGCDSKETKTEMNFLKIDIISGQLHIPSSITVDFKSKSISFSDLTQMTIIPEDCACAFEILKSSVEFEYIKFNEKDFNEINILFDKNFISDIKKFNSNYSKDKNTPKYLFGEGKRYRINFANDSTKFSTDDFLILDYHNQHKIYEVLKIIKKHTISTNNKKYINHLSFEFEK